jgi:site-specific recombinase XerC
VTSLLPASGITFEDCRDEGIVTLLCDTGLRLSGPVNLKLASTEVEGSDVDLDSQIIFVVGKGGARSGV